MKKRMLAALLALVMLVGLLPATVLAEDAAGPEVYVDATKGDDSTGKGTEESPYKTVGKALENIEDNATVYITPTPIRNPAQRNPTLNPSIAKGRT